MNRPVTILGAGVAGLCAAAELVTAGIDVTVIERGAKAGELGTNRYAGGMLAPWCEAADTEPLVATLGGEALTWWPRHFPGTQRAGTLAVAAARDRGELERLAARSRHGEWLDADHIAELEPVLAGRFQHGLYFADEGHLDPRAAIPALAHWLAARGVVFRYDTDAGDWPDHRGTVLDCRGIGARDRLPELRGVRGEMLLLESADITLSRPVRLVHPRGLVYLVPRGGGRCMLGGTALESTDAGPISARSAMTLLNGAYALHPAFAEARITELGAGLRPAFPDNLPRLFQRDGRWHLNGLYRHGFLLAPAMARQARIALTGD